MTEATKKRNLSHNQFYAGCEAMKKIKEELLTQRPDLKGAAKLLSEALCIAISPGSIRAMQETTGIHWEPKRNHKPKIDFIRHNLLRIICTNLRRLYKKLGEDIPASLEDAYNHLNGHQPQEEASCPTSQP